MSQIFSRKNLPEPLFSRVWEDYQIIDEALKVGKKDVLLSITSAGDNVLNLLLNEPIKIVAVDVFAEENSLLELKIAAIKHLSYDEYLCVLGEKEGSRLELYESLKSSLPQYAQCCLKQEHVINGLSSCGKEEFLVLRKGLAESVQDGEMDNLFEACSIEDQVDIFEKLAPKLKTCVGGMFNESGLWTDEQLQDIKNLSGSVDSFIWQRFSHVCKTLLAKNNFYLSWLMREKRGFAPDKNPDFAPPFLTREGFIKLKGLVERIEIYTGSLQDYLAEPSSVMFDKMNLSNIFEFMTKSDTEQLFEDVCNSLKPGGKLCYHTLLTPNKFPSTATVQKMLYLKELSDELYKKNRVYFYSGFHVFGKK